MTQPDTTELRTLAQGPLRRDELDRMRGSADADKDDPHGNDGVQMCRVVEAIIHERTGPLLDRLDAAETKVAAGLALADEWDAAAARAPGPMGALAGRIAARDLRAALATNQPTADPDIRIAGRCCQYPKVSACKVCGK